MELETRSMDAVLVRILYNRNTTRAILPFAAK